jgi:hypothetical protein
MEEGPGAQDDPHTFRDEDNAQGPEPLRGLGELERRELLAWVGEHLPYVRQTAVGQRPVYWILGIGVVIGLVAHVGGYALRASTTGEPLGRIADLLYALGYALWTGVIVVVFVQIFPEVKRRQYKAALDAYEAALREEAEAGGEGRSASRDEPPH